MDDDDDGILTAGELNTDGEENSENGVSLLSSTNTQAKRTLTAAMPDSPGD